MKSRQIKKEKLKLKDPLVDKELKILISRKLYIQTILENPNIKKENIEKTTLYFQTEYYLYKEKNNKIIE